MNEGSQSLHLKQEVHRLLGRCMLRIQQYERQMKAVLAHQEMAGLVDTLEAQRAARVKKLADKTLGTLVKALFESYVVVDGAPQRELLDESKVPTDSIAVAFRFSISMTKERRAQTKAAVDELVALRNDLIHHFIERFDLWSDDGCKAAAEHLARSYDRIDRHCLELQDWAQGLDSARAMSASFAQSDVFHNLLVEGIVPEGSFDGPFSGIGSALREGLQKFSVDGWASLDAVRTWVAEHHPEQSPEKYGCRSWPQVVHESRLFNLVYRADGAGKELAWFRERPARLRGPAK